MTSDQAVPTIRDRIAEITQAMTTGGAYTVIGLALTVAAVVLTFRPDPVAGAMAFGAVTMYFFWRSAAHSLFSGSSIAGLGVAFVYLGMYAVLFWGSYGHPDSVTLHAGTAFSMNLNSAALLITVIFVGRPLHGLPRTKRFVLIGTILALCVWAIVAIAG